MSNSATVSSPLCRWGILSTAQIARKNWKSIRLSGNGVVVGVSSRSTGRADTFIEECQAEVPFSELPKSYGRHEELLASDQIDAVYIPLPTGIREDWVLAAARAGKHVLIEKPVAVDTASAKRMAAACDDAGVQFMDGVMFDHGKRILELRDFVKSGQLGDLRRVQVHFSFAGDGDFQTSNIRTDASLEPHGCVGDLGWYCIRLIQWINDFRDPVRVSGRTIEPLERPGSDQTVPGEFLGEMEFADGLTAGFFCSFRSSNQQTATVSGNDGYLTIDDFVLPLYDSQTRFQTHEHDLEIDNCRWNFRRRSKTHSFDEYHSGESNAPEVQMVRTFADAVLRGEPDQAFSSRALRTQHIMDTCLRSAAEGGGFVDLE